MDRDSIKFAFHKAYPQTTTVRGNEATSAIIMTHIFEVKSIITSERAKEVNNKMKEKLDKL